MQHGGHRLFYIRLIAEHAAALGRPAVLLTTQEAVGSDEFAVHLSALVNAGQLLVHRVGSATESHMRLVRRAVGYASREHCADLVVPDSDRLLYALLVARLRRSGRTLGLRTLIMRTAPPGVSKAGVTAWTKTLLSRCIGVGSLKHRSFFLTDAFGVVTSRRGYAHSYPLPDPTPELPIVGRTAARSRVGIPDDAFVLGLLGDVSARKHPRLALGALASLPPDSVLLIAGRLDEGLLRTVHTEFGAQLAGGRVVLRTGYLPEEDLGTCLSACDAVLLTYLTDAPSGMLTSSVRAGISVIAGGSPWLCHVVRTINAGLVTELSVAGIVRAAEHLIEQKPPRPVQPPTPPAGRTFAATLLGV